LIKIFVKVRLKNTDTLTGSLTDAKIIYNMDFMGDKWMDKKLIALKMLPAAVVLVILAFFITTVFLTAHLPSFFTVKFETNYGTPVDPFSVRNGETFAELPVTQRAYNTFLGWFLDADLTVPYNKDKIVKDTTLYAKWATVFTAEFFDNYGAKMSACYEGLLTFKDTYRDTAIKADGQLMIALAQDAYNVTATYLLNYNISDLSESVMTTAILFENPADALQFYKDTLSEGAYAADMDCFCADSLVVLTLCGNKNTLLGSVAETDDYVFCIDETGGEVTLIRCKTHLTEPVIPSEFNGIPVKSIGAYAFYAINMSWLTLGDNIECIGDYALAYSPNLNALRFPANLNRLGSGVITGSTGFDEIDFNGSDAYEIYDGSLYDNNNGRLIQYMGGDTQNYVVRDGTICVGDCAFIDCGTLVSISLPEGLIRINQYAFKGCYSLGSISIPASVLEIGDRTFYYKGYGSESSLSAVIFASDSRLKSIGDNCFFLNKKITDITLPASTMILGKGAFRCCTGLEKITLGNDIETIPESCFESCVSLTSISLPKNVDTVEDKAFQNCSELTSINLSNIRTFGEEAFFACGKLDKIELSDELENLEENTFSGCAAVKALNFRQK